LNPKIHAAIEALWLAEPVLESVVLAALIRRRAHRQFPWFTAYIAAQIVTIALLYPLKDSRTAYFYVYWLTALVSLGLGFAVIHEVFVDVFKPYHTLRDLGSVLFKWAGLVMLLVAAIMSASGQVLQKEPLVDATMMLERSMRVVQTGLILFLLLFSKYLGISWRQRSFGIALGFGTYATIELSVVALRLGAHISEVTLNFITMTSYILAIGIWIAYALMKEASRETAVTLLKSQRWEQSLSDLHTPAKPDSLIPMFEGMVDRAFSKTHSSFQAIERSSSVASPTTDVDVSSVGALNFLR
jgi:hypothetical protein